MTTASERVYVDIQIVITLYKPEAICIDQGRLWKYKFHVGIAHDLVNTFVVTTNVPVVVKTEVDEE